MNSMNRGNQSTKTSSVQLKLDTTAATRADTVIRTESTVLNAHNQVLPTNLSSAPAVINASNVSTFVQKEFQTPNSLRKARNGTFQTFPIVNTPTPPSRYRKIVNPFEAGLTERLHLPIINSPSLFHRPATPQMCSTQLEFEWTIDEVSSLNPANVEAHETQFHSVIDPEFEAKAQAAISTYFKEKHAVPSPDDCPLREQKIILNKSVRNNVRITRDNSSQTELTLPPILPKHIEDALRPYFTFTQNQQNSFSERVNRDDTCAMVINDSIADIDHEARDESLRRKLFYTIGNTSERTEFEREVLLDSPAPRTPEMNVVRNFRSRRFLTPMNTNLDENRSPLDISPKSIQRESFGCISPISKDPDPASTPPSMKNCLAQSTQNEKRNNSPSLLFRSTPDRSSILRNWRSLDTSSETRASNSSINKRKSFHMHDDRSSESSETINFSYEDDMHLSYGSQQHPQTPTLNKSKRRCSSVNRKNLSRSFSQMEEQSSAISLDRTDSGFNDTNESAVQINPTATVTSATSSQPKCTTSVQCDIADKAATLKFENCTDNCCDISMASVN